MKKKVFVGNAFSLAMLSGKAATVKVTPLDKKEAADVAKATGFTSCVGHADTAACISQELGCEVPMNRINLTLEQGDVLFVAQLTGGRLPEGATTLPEGFSFAWQKVELL